MEPFQVDALGAAGFVQGQRLLAIAQVSGQGSLDLVECQATGEGLAFTVFVRSCGAVNPVTQDDRVRGLGPPHLAVSARRLSS